MTTIEFLALGAVLAPPAADVYLTRRNQSKYLTKRYWDGQAWFEIGFGSRRGGIPFT